MIAFDRRWLADDTSRDLADFRWMGSYHVNRYMSYFKQTSIVIDTLQNHTRLIFQNCTTPNTTPVLQVYLFIKFFKKILLVYLSADFRSLKFHIFLQISMSCFLRKNMVSQSFWKYFSLITWRHHQKKCFKSWNDHNWFWSAR